MKKLLVGLSMLALVACSGQHYGDITGTPETKPEPIVVEEVVKIDYTVLNETIYFDFDEAVLTPDSVAKLLRKVEWLNEHENIGFIIEGHCDKRGSNDYNLELGLLRAEAAEAFLIDHGIDQARIELETYNSDIIADANNDGMNRRCEFIAIIE